jgi:phytoene/squalene synthetase
MLTTPASSITKAASKQTYYTIRFLVDRERVEDAYRAYGYFRWVDDTLDAESGSTPERIAFLERQKFLLEQCYRRQALPVTGIEENMLVELVQHDQEKNSGLQLYLRNMMQVMDFDTWRRSRLISQPELDQYTRWLSCAVMEAIHYFIGHDDYSPRDETRYLAVSGAHITHMLRDTLADAQLGYYNIPREILGTNHMDPQDVRSDVYRDWVESRVLLAREYFRSGKEYFARVQNPRCRLACFAYVARFEWLLDTIEREGYCLRPRYDERKSIRTGLWMSWLTVSSAIIYRTVATRRQSAFPHSTGEQ